MAISVAVQKGKIVYVYDEKNRQIGTHGGELYGYTGGTVSVKKGSIVYTYDEKGRQISTKSVR